MHIGLSKPIFPRFTSLGLLLFLVMFFGIAPFFSDSAYARFVLDLSVISLLILSVYMFADDKRYLLVALVFASPALLRLVYPILGVDEITLALNACFFGFVIFVLLKRIFMTRVVKLDVIYAAVVVYILLGVLWGIIYALLEYIWGGSFSFSQYVSGGLFIPGYSQDLIYYSFITLTTLGYGDILPLSQPAKSLSALEAMMGQIYLTVLVARLVGMHLSQNKD